MHPFLRSLYITLLICSTAIPSLCQVLPFQQYTTKEGLPSNHVTALYQDSRGFLWIGTDNGLSVYDGIEFRNFTTADGLSNLYITDIIESHKHPGTYWIGTIAGGLFTFQRGRFSSIPVGNDHIEGLREDAAGAVWCAEETGNYRIIGDSVTRISSTDQRGSEIQNLGSRGIAIITAHHLERYRLDGSFDRRHALSLKEGEYVVASHVDSDSVLWLFSSQGTLVRVKDTLISYHRLNAPLKPSQDIPSHIMGTTRNSLWVTTPSGVIVINTTTFDLRTVTDFGNPAVMLSGPSLYDRENIIWMGTYATGLLKLTEQHILQIRIDPIDEGAYNLAACSDSNGHIWVQTVKSLVEIVRVGNSQWKSFSHQSPRARSSEGSPAVFIDPGDRLWQGALSTRRVMFNMYEITHHVNQRSALRQVLSLGSESFPGYASGLTFTIDQFERGWFAVFPLGLATVNLRTRRLERVFTEANGLPKDGTRAMLVDRNGNVWAGSWTAGLAVKAQGSDSLRMVPDSSGIPRSGVRSLYEDREGRVWIGTRYGGLVRYQGGTYSACSVKDGLLSNAIWCLTETDHKMWCGTDVGLEIVDKETCKPLLPRSELIGKRVYACGAFKNEYVWCALADELIIYEYPEVVPTVPPPPVYIKSYEVNGMAIYPDSVHSFTYDQNSCIFDFVGVSFRNERNVRYQYRMIGHDSSWTKPTKQHSVTYASLQPGSYEFQVRAINGDGISSQFPATVAFVITPPFWIRWWFITGVILLVLSILFSLYRYRLYHLMNLERMRLRIASDLHDDVGTNLSSIVISSQIIERDGTLPAGIRSQLHDIRLVAATTQDMMRDIVWMLNPSNDSLDEFILKMKETAPRLLGDVPCTFVVPAGRLFEKVSIEFKRNVFLIFKEALTNIARHSGATHAAIHVSYTDGTFILQIKDNGRGFDAHQSFSGSGMGNLKRRAELLGGRIEFIRPAEEGTVVTLSVQNHANA